MCDTVKQQKIDDKQDSVSIWVHCPIACTANALVIIIHLNP